MNAKTHEVICTACAVGSCHDFKFYEQSVGGVFLGCIEVDGVVGQNFVFS